MPSPSGEPGRSGSWPQKKQCFPGLPEVLVVSSPSVHEGSVITANIHTKAFAGILTAFR